MTPRSAAVDRSIELESQVAAPNYQPIPVVLQSGRGEWLFDLDGRRYLDLMSAYSAVSHGHAHPRLLKALTEQAAQVAVTSRAYHSATLGAFLEHLTGLCGLSSPQAKALPSSGGAEAVETAIKAARRWGYRVKGIAPDAAEIAVARGKVTGLLDFERAWAATPDWDLDQLIRFVHYPSIFASSAAEHSISPGDLTEVIPALQRGYPDLFAVNSLPSRLRVYALEYELRALVSIRKRHNNNPDVLRAVEARIHDTLAPEFAAL